MIPRLKLNRLLLNIFDSRALNPKNFSKLTPSQEETVNSLFNGIVGNRRAELARSITLVETSNPVKKNMAQVLLNKLLTRLKENRQNNAKVCLRIGSSPLISILVLISIT
jgi:hypothetical protein